MTTREARLLRPGDPVVWLPDGMPGAVESAGGGTAVVLWEDGGRATASLWGNGAEWWADVGRPEPEKPRTAFLERLRSAKSA